MSTPTPEPENPPAFPGPEYIAGMGNVTPITLPNGQVEYQQNSPGMTLRDYFAAKAMAAILSNPASYDAQGFWRQEESTVSEMAFNIADDMLKARAAK